MPEGTKSSFFAFLLTLTHYQAVAAQECHVSDGLDALESEILASPHALELMAIANDLVDRVAASDQEALRTAYKNGSKSDIALHLGFDEEEMEQLGVALEDARTEIFKEFPEVVSLLPHDSIGFGLTESEVVEMAISMIEAQDEGFSVFGTPGAGGVDCAYVPYTASLALCTKAGPVLYFACAAVATCHWCSGGWVNEMCAIP